MKFKDINEPIYTSDLYYDLFDGGYICPEDLLENVKEAEKVRQAILLIQEFLEEAEDNGAIELG